MGESLIVVVVVYVLIYSDAAHSAAGSVRQSLVHGSALISPLLMALLRMAMMMDHQS